MEELKLLIEMVANLPALAVWVLVGYLAYKVVVVGSIYGVIRLAIVKYHDYKTAPKTVQAVIGGRAIDTETLAALQAQIARCCDGHYIHMANVTKLRKALDLIEKGDVK